MFKSLPQMLQSTIDQYPDNVALCYMNHGDTNTYTYREFGEMVRLLTLGMAARGLKNGDRIAILSNNRPEWTITDFAGFALRAMVVPIYQTLPPNQVEYILKDAGVRAVFVENGTQLEKIRMIQNNLSQLEFLITFEKPDHDAESVILFKEILEDGRKFAEKESGFYEKSLNAIDPEDICSIVYTSGTTGEPKGVMLHHKGFIFDIVQSEKRLNIYPDDVFLSFLPLSHLYERLAGHWCPIYRGARIHYARSIDTVIEDIAIAKPTVMVSVPRLYEKIAAKVHDQVEHSPGVKRNLFYWAVGTGLEYNEQKMAGTASAWLEARYRLADKLVFSKLKKKLGGRFRCPIAGGAPLSVETAKFFEAIGLRIIEGYGMTETHLIIALTPPGKTRYGSCGMPIEGIEVRVAEDGEVLVRGDILMAGYYKKEALTNEMIDDEGWLHTGDIGHLDEDNYLFLTDRKKNIIVTSGGKNVAPAPIEHQLKTSLYIDDACLVGDKRKFISAILIPNYEMLEKWARDHQLKYDKKEELTANQQVLMMLRTEIEELQDGFATYEQVKKFIVLPQPLTIEKGELTPSLKIKRNVVEEKYKKQIDALYR